MMYTHWSRGTYLPHEQTTSLVPNCGEPLTPTSQLEPQAQPVAFGGAQNAFSNLNGQAASAANFYFPISIHHFHFLKFIIHLQVRSRTMSPSPPKHPRPTPVISQLVDRNQSPPSKRPRTSRVRRKQAGEISRRLTVSKSCLPWAMKFHH